MIDAIWYVLMCYFDQIKSKQVPLFIIKNTDYSYTPGYTVAIGYFAPRVKNILSVMRFYQFLHKNSFGHLSDITVLFFGPPHKLLLEKKWTIYLLYLYCMYIFKEYLLGLSYF